MTEAQNQKRRGVTLAAVARLKREG